MRPASRRSGRSRRILGAATLTLLVAACDRGGPMTTAGDATAVRSYTARGVVLEATDDALTVHHEAIDDFVGSDGRVIGMDPMAMRFRRGRGVGAGAVDEGDKIRFRFDVRTDGHPYLITEARKLPPGTVMDFRAARPPGPP